MSKECMFCGEDNTDNATVCASCGASLAGHAITTTDTDIIEWTITCPKCGHIYHVDDELSKIIECQYCDDEFDKYEIASVLPKKNVTVTTEASNKAAEVEQVRSVLVLVEPRKAERIEILSSGMIGRSGDIGREFFEKDKYVSEEHCLITLIDGVWRVEHIGHCNPTIVNSFILKKGFPVALKNGDLLRIADLYFKVAIEYRTAQQQYSIDGQVDSMPINQECCEWEIVCPVCGAHYAVADEDSRIEECTGACRFDDFDKYEIASVKARRIGS